ncbi:MAG: hypothetical protein AABY22_04980, partial [Nanoarchaeota archaeon]
MASFFHYATFFFLPINIARIGVYSQSHQKKTFKYFGFIFIIVSHNGFCHFGLTSFPDWASLKQAQ